MEIWPLDDGVLQEGYDEVFPDNVARFGTDIGPGKLRPRSTAAPTRITCQKPLTLAETEILDAFFETNLSWGALSFKWKHPRKGTEVTMHFATAPSYAARGALFTARMEIEVEA